MGDFGSIMLEYNSTDNPFIGESCIKIEYSAEGSKGWAGIYWLYPNNNWGNQPEGRNLNGANTLSFMAKGANGGEKAEFKIGGVSGKYQDSLNPPVSTFITLKSKWKEYSIDLKGSNLSNVMGGFCWVTNSSQNPRGCVIYLDNIVFK